MMAPEKESRWGWRGRGKVGMPPGTGTYPCPNRKYLTGWPSRASSPPESPWESAPSSSPGLHIWIRRPSLSIDCPSAGFPGATVSAGKEGAPAPQSLLHPLSLPQLKPPWIPPDTQMSCLGLLLPQQRPGRWPLGPPPLHCSPALGLEEGMKNGPQEHTHLQRNDERGGG